MNLSGVWVEIWWAFVSSIELISQYLRGTYIGVDLGMEAVRFVSDECYWLTIINCRNIENNYWCYEYVIYE